MANFATNASGAMWWPNLQPMQVAPSGGQICNYCKWCHIVDKFNPSHGVNFWVRCASGNVSSSIFVFNSDNDVPIVDNLAPIENITSFGQCGPNYGHFNIFSFISTLFGYTYPFDYPYHKVDNYGAQQLSSIRM